MSKIKKYITNLDVQFISLVKKGANKRTLIYKSAGASEEPSFERVLKILKADEEKQLIYCAVYAPDEADAHQEAMTAEEIEKAAHGFLSNARTQQVDKQHNEVSGEGQVVESFILKSADERFPGEKSGAWVVAIKVSNEETWAEVKKGDITGISLSGLCNKVEVQETAEKGFFARIEKMIKDFVSKGSDQSVEKSFQDKLKERRYRDAINAFESEGWSIINSSEIMDKKSALITLSAEFQTYIAALDDSAVKSFKPSNHTENMSEKAEKEDAVEQITKADLSALSTEIKALSSRLEAIEKSAPGRQSSEGREEKTSTKKGLPILD